MSQGYFAYNIPLQVWPRYADPEDDKSPVVGADVLNYMPRKEMCSRMVLEDAMEDMTREEFFEQAAKHLENLARMMREAAKDPSKTVYYADE